MLLLISAVILVSQAIKCHPNFNLLAQALSFLSYSPIRLLFSSIFPVNVARPVWILVHWRDILPGQKFLVISFLPFFSLCHEYRNSLVWISYIFQLGFLSWDYHLELETLEAKKKYFIQTLGRNIMKWVPRSCSFFIIIVNRAEKERDSVSNPRVEAVSFRGWVIWCPVGKVDWSTLWNAIFLFFF